MRVKRRDSQHTHLCTLSPAIYFTVFDVSREAFLYVKLLRIQHKELFCRYEMCLNKKKKKKTKPASALLTHHDHSKGKMKALLFLDAAGGNETMGHEHSSQPFFSVGAPVAD